jgi:ribosomal protein S18 acetylase RimI-like enzyme
MAHELVLHELAGEELAGYVVYLEASYAREMHELGGVALDEARQLAHDSTLELFPDGRPAAGHQLWRAVDGDGQPVGILWLARRDQGTVREHAWIYDIEVEAGRRGQGWGRLLMERAEQIALDWGLRSLRLNVFGDNEVARRLYRSRGFREQSVIMTKVLSE